MSFRTSNNVKSEIFLQDKISTVFDYGSFQFCESSSILIITFTTLILRADKMVVPSKKAGVKGDTKKEVVLECDILHRYHWFTRI